MCSYMSYQFLSHSWSSSYPSKSGSKTATGNGGNISVISFNWPSVHKKNNELLICGIGTYDLCISMTCIPYEMDARKVKASKIGYLSSLFHS